MRNLLILIVLLLSFAANAKPPRTLHGDFEVFPLSTSNIVLIEGVWRGEEIDIGIRDSGYRLSNKPIMLVEIRDHKAGESKNGVMYYQSKTQQYSLYMYEEDFRTVALIPIEMGIKEFSGAYTTQSGQFCDSGMILLKIEFVIDQRAGEFVFTKESCE